jgi:hypothetical protein
LEKKFESEIKRVLDLFVLPCNNILLIEKKRVLDFQFIMMVRRVVREEEIIIGFLSRETNK